jgi:hypothetical protein
MTTSSLRVHSGSARARKASATLSGGGKRLFGGKGTGAQAGAHDPGIEQAHAHPGLTDFAVYILLTA